MASLLQLVNEQFAKWVEEENRQLRIIEEAAASLVAAAKTHPARKPHLKRLREAQKNLENASEQCILYTKIADELNSDSHVIIMGNDKSLIDQLKEVNLSSETHTALNKLQFI